MFLCNFNTIIHTLHRSKLLKQNNNNDDNKKKSLKKNHYLRGESNPRRLDYQSLTLTDWASEWLNTSNFNRDKSIWYTELFRDPGHSSALGAKNENSVIVKVRQLQTKTIRFLSSQILFLLTIISGFLHCLTLD